MQQRLYIQRQAMSLECELPVLCRIISEGLSIHSKVFMGDPHHSLVQIVVKKQSFRCMMKACLCQNHECTSLYIFEEGVSINMEDIHWCHIANRRNHSSVDDIVKSSIIYVDICGEMFLQEGKFDGKFVIEVIKSSCIYPSTRVRLSVSHVSPILWAMS